MCEDANRGCGDQEVLTNGQFDSFRPWQWPWLHLKKARVANRRSQGCAELSPTRTVRKSPWACAVAGGGGLQGLCQNDDTRQGLGWPCFCSSQSPSCLRNYACCGHDLRCSCCDYVVDEIRDKILDSAYNVRM